MITIFEIPNTDQSVYYLGQVFGFVGNVLPVQTASALLGTMFRVLNSTVLSVAALIILYVSVVGIMKTAAEGEFLGRGWSTLWTPIRMVLGIAALVPTASGYSAIQIVMMWVVLQGIGAADLVWNTVLKYTKVMGSPYSTVTVPGVSESSTIPTIFEMLVCQRAAYSMNPMIITAGSNQGRYYCGARNSGGRPDSGFCSGDESKLTDLNGPQRSSTTSEVDGKKVWTFNLANGVEQGCGSFTFCDQESACADTTTLAGEIQCNTCKKSVENLQAIVTTFDSVAQHFTSIDEQYRQFFSLGGDTPGFVQSYCNANGLKDKNSCCVQRQTVIRIPGQQPITAAAQGTENCAISMSDGGDDPNGPPESTVTKLYWPYGIKPFTGDTDFIQAAVDRYVGGLNEAALEALNTRVTGADLTAGEGASDTEKILAQASEQGWIFAGAYYYWLGKQDKTNTAAANPPFAATLPTSNPLGGFRNNLGAAGNVSSLANVSAQSSLTASIPPELSGLNKLSSGLSSAGDTVMRGIMKMLTGGESTKENPELATDPLVKLQYLGYVLLIVAQALFALIIAVTVALTFLGYFNVFALGTGVTNPIGPAFTTLAVIFAPIFTLILGSLFTFGALLSIYTPLIPYIIFTMGAIGWFILVIEAMVAAPLVAIGILLPGGQSEILGKAEGALMYAFGLFLRPSLMVFGMMAGMLLSVVVVTMINAGFLGVVATINANPGLVEMFLFLGAYVGVVLAALNKCFSLIYIIPDRVLRWIGGHPEETGPGEGLTGAKGGVEAAGGAAQKMGGEAYGRGSTGLGGQAKKGMKEAEAKKAKEAEAAAAAAKLKAKGEQGAENKGGESESEE